MTRMTQADYDAFVVGQQSVPARASRRAVSATAAGGRRGAQAAPTRAKPKTTTAAAPAKRKRKTAAVLAAVALQPAGEPTRGPWTVSVECVAGRPITVNDERAGAMSYATFKRVREAQAAWKAAFVEAIRHVGLPPIAAVHVTVQPFYPNDVVPDADGLAPIVKAGLDSLVEAGVLVNDKRAQLPLGFLMLPPVSDGGLPRVAMTIHPLS